MLKNLFKSEDIRRRVNPNFDTEPSYGHIFYFESSKEFIKGKKVLDVGCWTGQLEQLAHKHTEKIIGIDPNPAAISFAKKKLPSVKFLVASAEKLPFPASSFDTVFLIDVIEHVTKGSELQIFKQIHRVIKPGGILIFSTDSKNPISILSDPAYFLIGHRHYSMNEITQMLTETGFKIKKKRYVGNLAGTLYSVISILFKHTLGYEPRTSTKTKKFLLKEHAKDGFAHLFIIAEAVNKSLKK